MSLLGVEHSTIAYIFSRFQKICRFLLIFLYFHFFIFKSFDRKKIFIFFTLLFLVCFSNKKWMVFDLLFISLLLADFLSYKKILKVSILALIAGSFCVMLLNYFGFFPDLEFHRTASVIRYSFGFAHPNRLGFVTIVIVALIALLMYHQKLIINIVLIISVVLFCYFVPNSTTSSLTAFLFIASLIVSKIIPSSFVFYYKKNIFIITCLILCGLISVLYYIVINESGWDFFNTRFFNTVLARLTLSHEAYNKYGFSLLGQSISFMGSVPLMKGIQGRYFIIDSLYFYAPIVIGLIPTFIFFAFYLFAMKTAIWRTNLFLYLILLSFLVYSFSEGFVISSCLCMPLFILPFVEKKIS